jgi:drug/metabolite transporter (DMT)-like permease
VSTWRQTASAAVAIVGTVILFAGLGTHDQAGVWIGFLMVLGGCAVRFDS